MALFTDGPPSSMEDLSAQDSQLLTVASTEGIDLTQKLQLAHQEVGLELETLLCRTSPAGHMFWISPQPKVEDVVITPGLKLWHAFRTLEMVYADAYQNQLNDRYRGKRDQFRERARWAREKLQQSGVGMAQAPVPKAGTPTVTACSGAAPDGTYYVTMAWVNQAGEEGTPADATAMTIRSSTFLVQPSAEQFPAPQNVTGWNIYVGPDPDHMTQQNAVPVPKGDSWVQPNGILDSGKKPGQGQRPSYKQPIPRVIQRG